MFGFWWLLSLSPGRIWCLRVWDRWVGVGLRFEGLLGLRTFAGFSGLVRVFWGVYVCCSLVVLVCA